MLLLSTFPLLYNFLCICSLILRFCFFRIVPPPRKYLSDGSRQIKLNNWMCSYILKIKLNTGTQKASIYSTSSPKYEDTVFIFSNIFNIFEKLQFSNEENRSNHCLMLISIVSLILLRATHFNKFHRLVHILVQDSVVNFSM